MKKIPLKKVINLGPQGLAEIMFVLLEVFINKAVGSNERGYWVIIQDKKLLNTCFIINCLVFWAILTSFISLIVTLNQF